MSENNYTLLEGTVNLSIRYGKIGSHVVYLLGNDAVMDEFIEKRNMCARNRYIYFLLISR